MEDRHIVSIDLGTSKIAVCVAKINGNDVQIIYYKETPSEGIRYSSIFNVVHASDVVAKAIQEAEHELGLKITQAVVGMPRYAIRQETRQGRVDRDPNTCISTQEVEELKEFANDLYPLDHPEKEEIYGAVAQSFSDGEAFQIIENDIIGMASDVLEGNFKIFIGKKSDLNKIDLTMNRVNIAVNRKYFTADSTAKAVLTEAEMDNGVALIDFGAGCTSLSIYCNNIMRHYASIPFGGRDITNDIKSECTISERLAENIKLAYGACMPDRLQSLSEKTILIRSNTTDPNKQLPVKYLSEIITARVEEIMLAMLFEIQRSGFADKLRSGIVITGGSAQLPNLGNLILDISGYNVRTGYPRHLFSFSGCNGVSETSAATSIGMILEAKEDPRLNCIYTEGGESDPSTGEPQETTDGTDHTHDIDPEAPACTATEEETSEDGSLFDDDQTIIVEPEQKPQKPKSSPKPKRNNPTWTKVKEVLGDLFNDVNENR